MGQLFQLAREETKYCFKFLDKGVPIK